MTIPIKITCVSLNFQRLDDMALNALFNAQLDFNSEAISTFKQSLGFPVEQISIIKKCNAIIIVFCYFEKFSNDFVRSRVLSTWDKLSKGGIIKSIRHIKFFEDIEALKYLGECSVGLHSVTLGDSQVLSQINDALRSAAAIQPENPTLHLISSWLKKISYEVKLRTNLCQGNTSMERIATERINRIFEKQEKITLIGFGKSGKLIAKIITEEMGYCLKIANRSAGALSEIKGSNDIKVVDLHNYSEIIDSACIVFAVDSNEHTIEYFKELSRYLNKSVFKPKLLIDLGSPSIIKEEVGINTFTIKDISIEANKIITKRNLEINKARDIINKNCNILIESLNKEIGKIILNKQKNEVDCKLNDSKLNLFKVRNDAYKTIRKSLDKLDFIEVTTPCVVGVSTDPPKVDKGGAIDVFWQRGVKAFLRQSNQLYKQMIVASGLPKIYEIGPFWRAETDQSYRHLQESIGLDVEFSNPKKLEELYKLAYSIILNTKNKIWNIYKIKNKNLILPEIDSVPVITYNEAINILNSKGYCITFGEDLGLIGEAELGQIIKKERKSDVFIVINYPDTIKKFYTKKIGEGNTETFDIILSGWELASGAIRENNRIAIEKSMRLSGINPAEYNFYLSIIDGSLTHGGFCLGIDRLIAKLLNLELISEAVVFPRTFNKLIP